MVGPLTALIVFALAFLLLLTSIFAPKLAGRIRDAICRLLDCKAPCA